MKLELDKFVEYQNTSKNPYKCINVEHAMNLIPVVNLDLEIELRCFAGHCDFKIKPGLNAYEKILKELNKGNLK